MLSFLRYLTVLCSLGPPAFPGDDVAVAKSHTFALFCFTTDTDLAIAEAVPPPPAAAPAATSVAGATASGADGAADDVFWTWA